MAESRLTRLKDRAQEGYRKQRRHFWEVQRYNIQTFRRQPLAEISGSVGDIGTLLPILIALTEIGAISLSSTLVFGGLANILTGVVFGIPLPVQPMKAIAAVAIAQRFGPAEIASAGLFVAGAIGFLSITGLIQWFTRKIPVPVIKGIQVGTGLSLIMSAGNLYHYETSNNDILLLAFLALLASTSFNRMPYALIILLVGILTVFATDRFYDWGGESSEHPLRPGLSVWHPHVFVPSLRSFSTGTLDAGIGQLPLTTLNSVIAVSFLAEDLLPSIQAPSTTSLGLSVMAINLIGCWFGAMPVCHGSGGLAAQYRFGARSGASIIFLGLVKLLLGLFASKIASSIFKGFPSTLLCILIVAAGLELAKVGENLNTAGAKDLSALDRSNAGNRPEDDEGMDKKMVDLTEEERKGRWAIMLMTVAGIMAFHNDAVGFLAGMLCYWSFLLQDWWEERRARIGGPIRLGSRDNGEGA